MKGEAKEFSILSAAGAVIGTLIGLGLSFTALSPLVIGGVIAVVPAILFYAYSIYNSIEDLFAYAWLCAASAAIGVGLAAVATAISPGAMLGVGYAALTGAVIGAIAPIAGFLATKHIIAPIAEKASEYILSPMIEKVKGCFSSKEKEV
ncbi:MAG: hypothetical protein LKM43_04960 [Wolbachia endosymbiont of Penenirmus auritus]|nr:hypothetical protein [Wolbachia endosymbiont of Penenirmus auritus]